MKKDVTIDLELRCQLTGTTDMSEAEVRERVPALVKKMQNRLDREAESELHLRLVPEVVFGGI